MTDQEPKLRTAIRVWDTIRLNPGCELNGLDYAVATELEALGLVVSETRDDGDDRWYVAPKSQDTNTRG